MKTQKDKKASPSSRYKGGRQQNSLFVNQNSKSEQEIPDDEIFFTMVLKKEGNFFVTNVFEKRVNSYLFWLSLESTYSGFKTDSNKKRACTAFELGVLNMYRIVGKDRIEELNSSMNELASDTKD
ncbi:MAG: hypothetical protein OJF59_000609 [Cytophagales bacterium]|jgi:hypothetical protein|nr:MAG: hypothetical protein OJF59_000609 [Cytophagales bacterium]